jgi:hypothetical protein
MSSNNNPEQSAEPAKKRPRVSSEPDSSPSHSDGGDPQQHEMIHQNPGNDGKQPNESTAHLSRMNIYFWGRGVDGQLGLGDKR